MRHRNPNKYDPVYLHTTDLDEAIDYINELFSRKTELFTLKDESINYLIIKLSEIFKILNDIES